MSSYGRLRVHRFFIPSWWVHESSEHAHLLYQRNLSTYLRRRRTRVAYSFRITGQYCGFSLEYKRVPINKHREGDPQELNKQVLWNKKSKDAKRGSDEHH